MTTFCGTRLIPAEAQGRGDNGRGGALTWRYDVCQGPVTLAEFDQHCRMTRWYVRGVGVAEGIGDVVAEVDVSGESPKPHYYLYNHRGDVLVVLNPDGAANSTFRYDAFGNYYQMTGPFTPRYTFSTKEYLPAAGLYLYQYRVYDPIAGRWTQRDPIDYQDSINLYQFCGNNPVSNADPSGLGTVRIWTTSSKDPIVLNDVDAPTLRNSISACKDGSITKIEIVGHGSRHGITFGPGASGDKLVLIDGRVRYSDSSIDDPTFADTVRPKLAKGARIQLNGCRTACESPPWAFNNNHITKALSEALPDTEVVGNRTIALGNELSSLLNRDRYFRFGSAELHGRGGAPLSYRNGKRQGLPKREVRQ